MQTLTINDEYIPLIALLKAVRLANSGGQAQRMVEQGLVKLNGKTESRKRAKVRTGDMVTCQGVTIKVLTKKSNTAVTDE